MPAPRSPSQFHLRMSSEKSDNTLTSCWHFVACLQYLQGSLTGFAPGLGIAVNVVVVVIVVAREVKRARVDRPDAVALRIGGTP